MTSTEPTWADLVREFNSLPAEQRQAIWPELVNTFKLMRYAPSMLGFVPAPTEPQPHGLFRSHLDLPLLTPEQSQRMEPVFQAVFDLVKQHQHCECDPTVMAWRGAYAATVALLAPPLPDGPFSTPYVGDVPDGVVWSWRCSLPHGDYTAVVERLNKGWNRRDAAKAYKDHMKAKHSRQGGTDGHCAVDH